ncbi:MAG: hypothetical protein LBK58_08770 [Prevotellaceae bacterium]|jgi:hypothetical protein|nr:hypothetical protein [Prevotellaceae bacterium]
MAYITKSADPQVSIRIIGDNIDELLEESMKYVIREREYYEREIRDDLEGITKEMKHRKERIPTKERIHNSDVTRWSSSFGEGISIYYDPEHKISKEDALNLDGREFYRKYIKELKK